MFGNLSLVKNIYVNEFIEIIIDIIYQLTVNIYFSYQ